jgi:hypothetical protein
MSGKLSLNYLDFGADIALALPGIKNRQARFLEVSGQEVWKKALTGTR